jgi:tripartite-type tricarboxylate transporter receptor subunit TctC
MLCIARWAGVTTWFTLLGVQQIWAQSTEEFYEGKTVTLIVGFEVGGGYDLYARLLARHYGKYVKGATFVVQNMTGAGSLRAANHIFNVAPKDGTVLGTVVGAIPFEPLFGNSQAQFTAEEFSWVGSLNSEVSTCQMWHTAPITRFEDARTTEIAVGGTGSGADSNVFPRALNAFTGTKFKIVSGIMQLS